MKKRLLTVVGARPQFVKAAALSRRLADPRFADLDEALCHTGQHYDREMSQSLFDDLGIPAPRWNLAAGSGSHGAQTGAIMRGLETVVEERRPDIVLVYGDTNSTLAAALVAAKAGIALAHVEAGLRSYRRAMPEEINRVVTDRLSDLLFCPTDAAVANLASAFPALQDRVTLWALLIILFVALLNLRGVRESGVGAVRGYTTPRRCTRFRAPDGGHPLLAGWLVGWLRIRDGGARWPSASPSG